LKYLKATPTAGAPKDPGDVCCLKPREASLLAPLDKPVFIITLDANFQGEKRPGVSPFFSFEFPIHCGDYLVWPE